MHGIERLNKIRSKPEKLIVGLMSGTSLDGLDIALCKVSGVGSDTNVQLQKFTTTSYTKEFVDQIRTVFSVDKVNLMDVCTLNPLIGTLHGEMVANALQQWGIDSNDIDLIASHGQTIFHAPISYHQQNNLPNSTLQIGDGDHVARASGIITLADFRQRHIAAGGEGAPLVVYGDHLIFSSNQENRIMLNIGGIANLTLLKKHASFSDIFSTDVGPGNTMMDAYVQANFPSLQYDENANIAKRGKVSEKLLAELTNSPFFAAKFPKTTGPELFNLDYLKTAIRNVNIDVLSHEDILATLCAFSAEMIVYAINECTTTNRVESFQIYASGGGYHNPLLMSNIARLLPDVSIQSTAALGVNPDAKEAILFALLANECVCSDTAAEKIGSQQFPITSMGKICFPG